MNTRLSRPMAWAAVILLSAVATPQSAQPPADHQKAPTFKTETNLVLVPVVVRDAKGNAIGGLHKEDFQILDKGKPQPIVSFSVQEPSAQVPADRSAGGSGGAKPTAGIPQHYVALLFDDLHMKEGPGTVTEFPVGDLAYSREAALKFLDTLQPDNRVALFTTTGEHMVDFTSDRGKLKDELLKTRQALRAEAGPALSACGVANLVERESQVVVRMSAAIVRRMALLPGSRTMVVVSPGLLFHQEGACPWSLVADTMQVIDRALRAHVLINGLDARGLAVTTAYAYQGFQEQLADGTGGRFITDTNDLTGALRRLAATPEYIYVLGISPPDLKLDGKFHALTVKVEAIRHADIQARKGYWATGQTELAEEEIGKPAAAVAPSVDVAETQEVAKALGIAPAPPNAGEAPEAALVTTAAPEISTSSRPVTFKVQSNLVEVPVVVRDRGGHAVGNLRQEDFRVFDKGKRQEIARFSVQTAPAAVPQAGGSQNVPPARDLNAPPAAVSTVPPAPSTPNHFVAFLFDDVHIRTEDLPQVRAAVVKYINTSLHPGDRVAVYTTSGRFGVDFTDHPEQATGALLKIAPRPIRAAPVGGCGAYVSYFQAVQVDQQVGLEPLSTDTSKCLALRVAVEEYGDFRTAVNEIRDAYSSGLQESRAVLAALRIIVQRMAAAPGQRSLVLVSPGFFVPADLQNQSNDLISLAIRSKVLISSVDARGVWTIPVYDACQKGNSADVIRDETSFRQLENEAATDPLIQLADGTGGAVNLDNDFLGGVHKAASAPEYIYVLSFVPQNLKADGSFHPLKVTVDSGGLTLQARRGYWAPKQFEDAEAAVKQEIEDAVFAREEVHGLPVEMHTQVTQAGGTAKLDVLTSVDLKLLHLRKADGRNRDDVTIVAAVFDANGNFIVGAQKVLQLRLRDETVSELPQKQPVTIETNFDMKPGEYLVRLVARDGESQEITAENAGVRIPEPAVTQK